jgi:hypothetical protein
MSSQNIYPFVFWFELYTVNFVFADVYLFIEQLVKRTKEASLYYEKAAELQQTDNAMSAIVSLHKAFACDLKHAQYQHASETLQWIIKWATEQSTLNSDTFYVDVKVEAMVSFILVLILQV